MNGLLLLAGAVACPPPAPASRVVSRRIRVRAAVAIPVVVGAVVLAALVFDSCLLYTSDAADE